MSNRALRITVFVIAGILALALAGPIGADDTTGPPPGTYRITDGKVDWGTFAGWFTYQLSCQMCHGQDVADTGVAPDLRKSIRRMTAAQFANKVLARYRIFVIPGDSPPDKALRESIDEEVSQQRRGEYGRLQMPVWPEVQNMKPHILDLYAYLKARSDGAIGRGPPRTPDD